MLRPGEDSIHALERHGRGDLMRYRRDVFDDKYAPRLRGDDHARQSSPTGSRRVTTLSKQRGRLANTEHRDWPFANRLLARILSYP